MARKFSTTVLDTLLKTVEVEFKVPLLGFGEIKFPVSEYAKKWWASKKSKEDLQNAIEAAESNFVDKNPNNKAAQILHDISLKDEDDFREIIGNLLEHLNEEKIIEVAALKLGYGFEKYTSREELQKALNDYLPYLRTELRKIEGFREVISTLTEARIEQTTTETLIITKEIDISTKEINSKVDQLLSSKKQLSVIPQNYEPERFINLEEMPEPGQLPPGSRLPYYRNAVFTGRSEDLKYLAKSLLSENKTTLISQAIVAMGMGGIGKTQLAIEFCYRYGRYFHGIHWINSREGRVDAEIAACGREMGLTGTSENLQVQVSNTLKAWQLQPFRLLVFDGLEDPSVLANWLPQLNGVHILITARRQQWSPDLGIAIHPIDTLPRNDSIILIRRLAPKLEETTNTDVETLAKRLGDLPLGLDLAGRYLNARRSLTVAEYLYQLDEANSALEHTSLAGWVKDSSPTSHENSLAATFLLSWQQLDEGDVDMLAKKFFIIGGYLAPNVSFPQILLVSVAISANDWHEAKTGGWIDLSKVDISALSDMSDDAVYRLQQLGLFDNTIALHPLLSEFARLQASDKSELILITERMVFISSLILSTYLPSDFAQIHPHLEALTPIAESNRLKNTALLWNSLGHYLYEIGQNHLARNLLKKALSLAKKEMGARHPNIIPISNNLASVLRESNEIEKSKVMFEEAIDLSISVYGNNAEQTATLLNNLGLTLLKLDLFTEAKQMFMQALKIDEAIFGTKHPKTATRLNNIGLTLNHLRDFSGAKRMYERSLRIRKKIYGRQHPHVAQSLHNLAFVNQDLKNFTKAKELFEQALQIGHEVYGEQHPELALWLFNYAKTLDKMGKFRQAKESYQQSIEMYKKLYGGNNSENAFRMIELVKLQMRMNEFSDAKKLAQSAVKILQKENHPYAKYALSIIPTINFLEMQRKKSKSQSTQQIHKKDK